MFVRNLKQGDIFYARYKISNPKSANNQRYVTESLKTESLSVALDKARERFAEIRLIEKQGRAIRSDSVAEEIDRYIAEYEANLKLGHSGYSPHMLRGYRKTIVRYFREYLGKKPLHDVSFHDLRDYEKWRQNYWKNKSEKGERLHGNAKVRASSRTLEWEINAFKQLLRWSHLHGRYSGSALDFVFKKGEANRRSAFTVDQWNRLVAFMRRKAWTSVGRHGNDARIARHRRMLRAYVLFLGHTGLRPGEARHLKWRDVRFLKGGDAKDSSVRVAIAASTSKVKKAREVVGGSTAYEALQRLLDERKLAHDNAAPNDYIWCDQSGRLVNEFREGFNALIRDASAEFDNENCKLAIYSLRHTYITFRLKENVDVFQLASNCGTSVAMIENYYSHARTEDFAKELTKRKQKNK